MSWRTLLGLVLLVAAAVTGWSAWNMRERAAPDAGAGQRSDYVLRDFELVTLGKDGTESVRLRAPELQRSREDESLDIVRPLFLMPGEGGGWQLAADRGWVRQPIPPLHESTGGNARRPRDRTKDFWIFLRRSTSGVGSPARSSLRPRGGLPCRPIAPSCG